MGSIEIRLANINDMEAVIPLFDQYRRFYAQKTDVELIRQFLCARLEQQGSVIFMVYAVGFTQLYPAFSSVSLARIFILNDLFVSAQARGAGVGKSLLDAARNHAQGVGTIRLSLSTDINNKAAQSLYEKQGWKHNAEYYKYSLSL